MNRSVISLSPEVTLLHVEAQAQGTLQTPPSESDSSVQEDTMQFTTPKPKSLNTGRRLTELRGVGCNDSPALRVPASPLMKHLGYGTGVGVYLMERSPKMSGEIRSPWAIKKIMKIKEARSLYGGRLEYEANLLKELNHPNIVGFKRFNLDPPVLAMEKASSSLSDLIEVRNEPGDSGPFGANCIEKVALHVGNALDYLHEEKKLIHGDLKSANVLVFGDFEVAKLCDFGVARKLSSDGTVEGSYVGTEVWNPMEVILQQNGTPKYPITCKADIYPFGLTIYEMISLRPPHLPEEEDPCTDSESSFDESAYDDILAERIGTRPSLPDLEFDSSYNKVLEIFYCCTEEDPEGQPLKTSLLC